MKLKKTISVMHNLSLVLAMSYSTLAIGTSEDLNPKLSKAEEGGLVLSETLLSITAGLVSSGNGCSGVPGGSFTIDVKNDGTGSAIYGSTASPISLTVSSTPSSEEPLGFGHKYNVSQKGVGSLDAVNSIQNFKGSLNYSDDGATLISSSVYEMLEFSEYVQWDGHNVKNFLTKDNTGRTIKDNGLEVIKKATIPISQWRQTSEHRRWNGSDGGFSAKKFLITPAVEDDCSISLSTIVLKQSHDRFIASGNIEVTETK